MLYTNGTYEVEGYLDMRVDDTLDYSEHPDKYRKRYMMIVGTITKTEYPQPSVYRVGEQVEFDYFFHKDGKNVPVWWSIADRREQEIENLLQ